MVIGSNDYKLILIDTNAIREIVTNTNLSGKGFLQRFFSQSSKLYAPCYSIYNVIELMPYQDIYEKFLDFFSLIPCFVIFPVKNIFLKEVECHMEKKEFVLDNKIMNAFTPYGLKETYNCKGFFEKLAEEKELMANIKLEVKQFSTIAMEWEKRRASAETLLKSQHLPLNMIDEKFYRAQEEATIIKDLKNFGIEISSEIDISKLPASRIMEYSQFIRIYQTHKSIKANDVMDIQISCIVPYVDAVITENFQADIYKKAKSIIPQLKKLEIYTLRDIRQ